jgi:hypothetical protein
MVELSIKTYKIECSYIWYMINLREHLTEFTYVTLPRKLWTQYNCHVLKIDFIIVSISFSNCEKLKNPLRRQRILRIAYSIGRQGGMSLC